MDSLNRLKGWISQTPGATSYSAVREDEHLMGKETESSDATNQALRQANRRLRYWLVATCSLLILATISFIIAPSPARPSNTTSQTNSTYPVPQIPTVPKTFTHNATFSSPSTPDSDTAWSLLSPPGDGFVLLPNTTLPPGKPTARGDVYDISLFHQLHCLAAIRAHLFTLEAARGRENEDEVYRILIEPKREHVLHCFDYLRQGVMCAGDLTVEWPRTEVDGARFAVDGWGVVHQCKDWDAIMEWMGEHSVANFF